MSEYQSNPSEKIVKPDGSSIVCWFCWWSLTWDLISYQQPTCLAFIHQSFLDWKVNQQIPHYWTRLAPDSQLQIMKWRQFLATELSASWRSLLPGDDTAGAGQATEVRFVGKLYFNILNIRYETNYYSQCWDWDVVVGANNLNGKKMVND